MNFEPLKSVRDVVQMSQIQIIAISEAIQQVHHNNQVLWFEAYDNLLYCKGMSIKSIKPNDPRKNLSQVTCLLTLE